MEIIPEKSSMTVFDLCVLNFVIVHNAYAYNERK